MTVEALSTEEAQTWFPTKPEQRGPSARRHPAEPPFLEGDAGDEWCLPVTTPPPFIPRVYPGL